MKMQKIHYSASKYPAMPPIPYGCAIIVTDCDDEDQLAEIVKIFAASACRLVVWRTELADVIMYSDIPWYKVGEYMEQKERWNDEK